MTGVGIYQKRGVSRLVNISYGLRDMGIIGMIPLLKMLAIVFLEAAIVRWIAFNDYNRCENEKL